MAPAGGPRVEKWEDVNAAACDLAREVSDEGNALVAGAICQTSLYKYHKDETRIKNLFRVQLEVFARKKCGLLDCRGLDGNTGRICCQLQEDPSVLPYQSRMHKKQ